MTRRTLDRRSFVRTTAALGVTTALAGCGGSGGDGERRLRRERRLRAVRRLRRRQRQPGVPPEEPDYGGFLDDANNYEQTVDMTGSDSVTNEVGAGEGLAFGPAAVAVSSGTTVTWEWTGEGGSHNVSGSNGNFEARPSARRAIPSSTRSRNPAPIRTSVRRMRRSA